jgi:hypothetical protein
VHVYVGLFACVCRFTCTCIQVYIHMYIGLYTYVYRVHTICILVLGTVYVTYYVCTAHFVFAFRSAYYMCISHHGQMRAQSRAGSGKCIL